MVADFLNRWRQSWRQSPGACLVFGVVSVVHVVVPVGFGATVLITAVWFPPDLSRFPVTQLLGLLGLFALLGWWTLLLTGWINRQWWRLRLKLGLA